VNRYGTVSISYRHGRNEQAVCATSPAVAAAYPFADPGACTEAIFVRRVPRPAPRATRGPQARQGQPRAPAGGRSRPSEAEHMRRDRDARLSGRHARSGRLTRPGRAGLSRHPWQQLGKPCSLRLGYKCANPSVGTMLVLEVHHLSSAVKDGWWQHARQFVWRCAAICHDLPTPLGTHIPRKRVEAWKGPSRSR
jgi:hypothetical protein